MKTAAPSARRAKPSPPTWRLGGNRCSRRPHLRCLTRRRAAISLPLNRRFAGAASLQGRPAQRRLWLPASLAQPRLGLGNTPGARDLRLGLAERHSPSVTSLNRESDRLDHLARAGSLFPFGVEFKRPTERKRAAPADRSLPGATIPTTQAWRSPTISADKAKRNRAIPGLVRLGLFLNR